MDILLNREIPRDFESENGFLRRIEKSIEAAYFWHEEIT
jgi:hypothetical protein